MRKRLSRFILLTLTGTLFLLPNFYNNSWTVVEPVYYNEWQIRYDRLVIARLVKSRQDGFFSAGGLLGLGDTAEWNFLSSTHNHQYDVYFNENEFQSYLVYKSNPGFQGVLYGVVDKFLNIPNEQKIQVYRGITATASALTLGFIFAFIATEFGLLAGVFTLLFSASAIWLVLPAGSIFWNLWALYLPFLASAYLLSVSVKKEKQISAGAYLLLFTTTLLRILLSGFDLITTGLIMTTVPIVYYALLEKWNRRVFIERFIKVGTVLAVATIAGLLIMSIQIASVDDTVTNVFSYIANRFGHHFAGNSEYYTSGGIEATRIGIVEITTKYLVMPAVTIPWPGTDFHVLFWHLIIVFAFFTILYLVVVKNRNTEPGKANALVVATWYSLSAPLSWILLFRPHSIIHTHVNTMGWQMPFTLLGFALCGFVTTELFKRKTV